MNTPTRDDLPAMYGGIDYRVTWAPCNDEDGEDPKDLSGYSAKVDIRTGKESTDDLIISMTVAITSEVIGDDTWWYVTGSLTDTQVDSILDYEEGYYGLLLISSADISEPWVWGKIKIRTDFPTVEV